MIGTTVQHYKILRHLGTGGMGEVYAAEDMRLGRTVALKILPQSYQFDVERRTRFFSEAQIASRLSSPRVATVFDFGEAGGQLFLAMELVEGEPLSTLLAGRPRTPIEAARIAIEIAEALEAAHAKGAIHRDVKPANVIVRPDGSVKVLDFGLAKFIDHSAAPSDDLPTLALPELTVAGAVLGTVTYMSPEQALGRPVDYRTDLFSLGVVLYEMVSGRVPFTGISVTETIDRIVHAPHPPLPESVGEGLLTVVDRALEKEPGARYQSATAMRADLEAVRDGRPVAPGPSAAPPIGLAAPRAHRIPNGIALLDFVNVTRDPADDWIGPGIAETVSADLQHVRGVTVLGRERVADAVRTTSRGGSSESDSYAIEVAHILGAEWIVAGGYQRRGDQIRVTARLLDVDTGALARAVKIDGRVDDIFAVQDRVVFELTEGLSLSLGGSEIEAIERAETISIEAYERYSRGMQQLRDGTRSSIAAASRLFREAVKIDPNYSLAWAALGAAATLDGMFLVRPDMLDEAVEYELKAIALNPGLAFAHEWLGSAYVALGRFDDAEAVSREAVRLGPSQASAHAGLGRVLWLGHGRLDEGVAALERAVAHDHYLGYAYLQLAMLYAILGQLGDAESAALAAIDLQGRGSSGATGLKIVGAHSRLGYVRYLQGRYLDAVFEFETERGEVYGTDHALRARTLVEIDLRLGATHLAAGDALAAGEAFARADVEFASLIATGADDPFTRYYAAVGAATRGDAAAALEHLRRAVPRYRAFMRVRADRDPDLAPIRAMPEYEALFAEP